MEAHPFAFVSTAVSEGHHVEVEDDDEFPTVTLPSAMKAAHREAMDELDKARSQLMRGNYRAAIQYAGDAVNRIAASEDLHGYCTY